MTIDSQQPNTKLLWTGRVLSGLLVLLFSFGIVMGFASDPQKIAQGFEHVGIPVTLKNTIMILEALSVVLYAIPSTAVIGAILITGYMGGAICTHLRIGENVALQTAIPIIAWLGLYLREPRLKALLPIRR